MNCSFIIITDSKKYKECCLQLLSIKYQKIEKYEVIVCGDISQELQNFIVSHNIVCKLIQKPEYAKNGKLGAMRNEACTHAIYENLIISDDDMLFSLDWYNQIKNNDAFDILTTRVALPDGTRFWDHCCYMSPSNGHIILNPDEEDTHLYMSGGQSWIMKKDVFNILQWDEDLKIYNMNNLKDYMQGNHNEDTEYSLRCRTKFKISHDHNTIVYHNDPSYTSYGRVVRRRQNGASHLWCKNIKLPPEILLGLGKHLLSIGYEAEYVDLIRKIHIDYNNLDMLKVLNDIDQKLGGPLLDSKFTFDNQHYNNLINILSDL